MGGGGEVGGGRGGGRNLPTSLEKKAQGLDTVSVICMYRIYSNPGTETTTGTVPNGTVSREKKLWAYLKG